MSMSSVRSPLSASSTTLASSSVAIASHALHLETMAEAIGSHKTTAATIRIAPFFSCIICSIFVLDDGWLDELLHHDPSR